MSARRRVRQAGQSMIEATLVLLAFFGLLLGVVDCGQVLFAHQSLVERTREAVRWGSLHPWDGPEPIVNMVLYGQTQTPLKDPSGYLGMTPSNVQVLYQPATPDRPDDETITVSIVNFESHLFSPWLSRVLVSARPVLVSAPVAARASVAAVK
ncbi:MAG TPA: TadE/TadG family type IV pilus assembly protein [Bryobacteraceae bacterium]